MKSSLTIIFLLLAGRSFGQNFVLPDGEYMDTTSAQNAAHPDSIGEKCKNYTAYFYSVGGKYPENSSSLLKEVHSFLQQRPGNYPGSGYISFRFTIDCEGKLMQKIQVLQTNENYVSTHFDKSLVNELFAFLKTLNKWKVAKTKDGEAISYKAFITFKIKNGKVINIIP